MFYKHVYTVHIMLTIGAGNRESIEKKYPFPENQAHYNFFVST